MRPGWAASPALLALLASCSVGPDYRAPEPLAGSEPVLSEARSPAFSDDPPPGDWWRLYNAPELDALIDKALVHNTDLRVSLASLQAAQQSLRATEAEKTPQTTLSAHAAEEQTSADTLGAKQPLNPGPLFQLSAAVSYDADLFGRIARGIEAGSAEVDAARAALDLARINVAASVVGAYVTVCSTGNRIAVANRSIGVSQMVLSVTERRFQGGIIGVNDAVRARALLIQTEARLPELQATRRAALHLLATLTGDPPGTLPAAVETCAETPVIRRVLPVGDGMALLKRRPDIREAERRLAASVAGIGVATSALYPSVSFGGGIGTIATSASDVLRDRAFTWSLGPLVSWNFPNQSAAEAEIARADAIARGNLAAFDGTVLTALRETETALVALDRQQDTERLLREARDQAAIAAGNTTRLYRGGIGAFLDMLDAERTLIDDDDALVRATSELAGRQVRLFLVLGGGWQDAPMPADMPLDRASVAAETK